MLHLFDVKVIGCTESKKDVDCKTLEAEEAIESFGNKNICATVLEEGEDPDDRNEFGNAFEVLKARYPGRVIYTDLGLQGAESER